MIIKLAVQSPGCILDESDKPSEIWGRWSPKLAVSLGTEATGCQSTSTQPFPHFEKETTNKKGARMHKQEALPTCLPLAPRPSPKNLKPTFK